MTVPATQTDLIYSQVLLDELFKEVSENAGSLSSNAQLPATAELVDALRRTKIQLGDPRADLIRLTPKLFKSMNIELNEIRKQQLSSQYDFYYLTVSVSLQPGRATQFSLLECSLDFDPNGTGEPIVQAIFPTREWHDVLQWEGSFALGINGDLGWSAGIDTPSEIVGLNLPAQVKANIDNRNTLKALIVAPDFSFSLGRAEIVATGEGSSRCFWRVEKPDLHKIQTVKFGVVFMVPQGTKTIAISGVAAARPSIRWLTESLRSVLEALSDRLLELFKPGKERIVIGDYMPSKDITLPQ